jgi:formylglycine-generating enzyme required for sulfatase activity
MRGLGSIVGSVLAVAAAGCGRGGASAATDAGDDAAPPWAVQQPEPEPRPGMAWIPPGVLIAGTPPDRLPRVADEEMAGEQVVMHGFYIDLFAYPNEAGAIPTTNLTQAEAGALCEQEGKRLCTELEWERACKGPGNTTYEYGDTYKASLCATGTARMLTPAGLNPLCASAFGVHDLHGGVWTWTASQWRRDPSKPALATLRGGNAAPGELHARCANGRGAKPEVRREDVGVRCCAGEPNRFEVVLSVTRGAPLTWQPPDGKLAPELEKLVPDEIRAQTRGRRAEDQFKVERMWIWHPLGNEDLVLGGGCAHPEGHAACGVVIARVRFETPALLAFVSSDWWQPTLGEADGAREVFLNGGDRNGAFRRKVSYEWGKIGVRDKERKKKLRGRKDPAYE